MCVSEVLKRSSSPTLPYLSAATTVPLSFEKGFLLFLSELWVLLCGSDVCSVLEPVPGLVQLFFF